MNNEINQVLEEEGAIVWKSVIALLLLPLITLVTVPWFAYTIGFTKADYIALLVFYILTGISITMGYHRLWSHKTYKANKFISSILMIFGSAALQNSILQWASDHRKHHKDVDDPTKDPYAATRGFWYSHFTWLFKYNNKEVQELCGIKDLMKDSVVLFQHKHYTTLAILTCLGLPALSGFVFGLVSEGTFVAAFWRALSFILLGALVRVILVHHATFCINSLAHILGNQPYSTRNTSRDSFITALVTGGEGYHNYHHTFGGDYRNGIRFYDFDPSKWLIACFSKVGWCYDLKRTPSHLVEIAKAKVKLDEAFVRKDKTTYFGIEEKYTKLVANVKNVYNAKQEYLEAKKDNVMSKSDIQTIKSKYKYLKTEFVRSKKSYKASTMGLII